MHATISNPGETAGREAAGRHAATMPLFHAAWLFAAGIASTQWIMLRPNYVLAALLPVAGLCVVAAFCARRVAWVTLAALWILLGAWCAQMEPHPAPAAEIAQLSDGLMRTVEGTVADVGPVRAEVVQSVDEPTGTNAAQRIDVRVASIEVVSDEADGSEPASGGVRLTVRRMTKSAAWKSAAVAGEAAQKLECGDRVRAVARLLPPESYHDPGVWSRADYLLDQGITSTAAVDAERVEVLGHARGAMLRCRVGALQHIASRRLLALPAAMRRLPKALRLSEDDAILLASMIAGDRTYLDHSLRAGFERTGSFHMLVVSGLHLGIVAACVFWLTKRSRMPRVAATLATIAASFAYALFTGFAAPVQRSLWMVALYLVGRLIYRERSPLNTIGFAALCLLTASPRSLLDSSFQMTLLAVVSIAGIAAPLLERSIHPYLTATKQLRVIAIDASLAPRVAQFRVALRWMADLLRLALQPARGGRASEFAALRTFPFAVRMGLRIAELMVVSLVVELTMTLPMAIYFHRVTIFALPVNFLILPLLVVLMPCALLTLIVALVWPAAAVVPAAVTAIPLHFGEWIVRFFGSLTVGDLRIPAPLPGRSFLFLALLALAMLLARVANKWMRRAAWGALIGGALIAVAPRTIEHPRNALLVEAIDVGQGDSILVIAPDGKTLLIDGGGFGGGPRDAAQDFDIGEEVVSPALWARGIRHLDAVALSHAHSDHMGGLPAVLRNFHPAELWVGNNPRFGAYDALLAEADGLGVRVQSFRAGDAFAFGDAQVNVLAPMRDYRPGAEPENNDSLVLHVAYGETSVLLEGDAEAPIERAMLGEQGLASTLLKVGHHGSISSTRPEFLARVAPRWAVISCGLRNRYGHPRTEVLEELQAAHVRTFRTDLNGASCFALDGKAVRAQPLCLTGDP